MLITLAIFLTLVLSGLLGHLLSCFLHSLFFRCSSCLSPAWCGAGFCPHPPRYAHLLHRCCCPSFLSPRPLSQLDGPPCSKPPGETRHPWDTASSPYPYPHPRIDATTYHFDLRPLASFSSSSTPSLLLASRLPLALCLSASTPVSISLPQAAARVKFLECN